MKDIHKTKKELLEEIQELRECNRDHNTRRHYRDINPGNRSEHDFCSESFYELSPLMYFTVDRQGIVREVNRLGARHLGYSRKELAGSPVTNVFYPEDREDAENLLKNCFENPDKVHRWELRKVKKDGNVIWVKEHARVGGFDNGNGLAIIICEDITEHKQAQFLLGTDKMMFDLMARHATLFEILSSLCLEIEKQSNGMLCSFLLLDENGKSLRHGAAPSLPEGYVKSVDGVEIGARVGSCGTAAYTKKPVIVTDIETDPLWADYKHLALKYDLRACWSNPIITADNRVLGTFACRKECAATRDTSQG